MKIDVANIRNRTVSIDQYIRGLEEPFRERFLATKQTYQLGQEPIEELKKLADKYIVIVFSASWCKDCAKNIPVLALTAERTGLEVRVFGGLKKDPLSHIHKWRIPPSPPEVTTFSVDKIPLMIVFDVGGKEIGRIVESAKQWPTLEQELCEIIKARYNSVLTL